MESVKWKYGRLSAGVEANISKIAECDVAQVASGGPSRTSFLNKPFKVDPNTVTHQTQLPDLPPRKCHLMELPAELIDEIFQFLAPLDLQAMVLTCQSLRFHGLKDLAWHHHVQGNVPGIVITSPKPCQTYRDLYYAHDPYWFIPKYKIWFNDTEFVGKLIIARYDPDRGYIEAYQLVGERNMPDYEHWEYDDQVIIHSFRPKLRLHSDQPIVLLRPELNFFKCKTEGNERPWVEQEMVTGGGLSWVPDATIALAREDAPSTDGRMLWPPPFIPSNNRVQVLTKDTSISPVEQPESKNEASQHAFRIRQKVPVGPRSDFGSQRHLTTSVQTFSTLDPKLYTPTPAYPWRGIWVGDYSGHGCEFLLMHQPDIDSDESEERKPGETQDQYRERIVFRAGGRLEAIKLTGDINVPSGQYTFIADDIGPDGFIRDIKAETQFQGARVVRSRGHIAERTFLHNKYITSELIIISDTKLAQCWVGFGHISFFERVDIESFLNPSDKRNSVPKIKSKTAG